MVQAVAEAVVAFQHVSDPGQTPVRPLGKLFEGQSVTGAFLPGERGLAVQGAAFGHPHGAGRKRIAVVEMGAEVEPGLQGMGQPGAPAPLVALLTDFGLTDPYVGQMKAVLATAAPPIPVLDLCHGIAPHDVRQAAFYLAASLPWLPPGAVVAVVVDPGVGTERRLVALARGSHTILAPDNGILTLVLSGTEPLRAFDATPAMRYAREHADIVVTSLFVNPTQFGPSEDLAAYPRDLDHDAAIARAAGVDVLFAPTPEAMSHTFRFCFGDFPTRHFHRYELFALKNQHIEHF